MHINELKERSSELIGHLTKVWECAVRATHHFLSEAEIVRIRAYVPDALAEVPVLLTVTDSTDCEIAFMGIDNGRIEMLFVADNYRGKGIGCSLIMHGIAHYSVKEVTVNEQNPQAWGFYEHLGFEVYQRTDTDEQGGPYPLLYMRLKS